MRCRHQTLVVFWKKRSLAPWKHPATTSLVVVLVKTGSFRSLSVSSGTIAPFADGNSISIILVFYSTWSDPLKAHIQTPMLLNIAVLVRYRTSSGNWTCAIWEAHDSSHANNQGCECSEVRLPYAISIYPSVCVCVVP